ncbi:MAG: 16S rRNA (cytosine(1402)-N(4))-methyltransferase RsmH [Bacteroidales bacterium]|nr:16S rRNA (cytosine(1402)-N(4))-methyltransferase RsmH [Bacteroidales bacterium]
MSEYHEPVLLHESVDGLNINPDGIYVDATFGGGGHSAEILSRLSAKGTLVAIDRDSDAHKNRIDDSRLKLVFGNYRYLRNYLDYYGIEKVDGVLADLGVSSHQFDVAERGFSFRMGGNLDMRMSEGSSRTAADVLNSASDDDLFRIFRNYCDVQNVGKLVKSIVARREVAQFGDIDDFVKFLVPFAPKNREIKYYAQIFQALRIEVNDEISALGDFLTAVPQVLAKGGRLSVISYHSMEDRLVKNLIRTGNVDGNDERDVFGRADLTLKPVNRQVIVPDDDEVERNPRAKSAKLRIAERV